MNELSKKKVSRTALHNHCEKIEKRINGLLEDFRTTDVVTLNGFKMSYENQVKKIDSISIQFQFIHNFHFTGCLRI